MSDDLSYVEALTNGKREVTGAQSPQHSHEPSVPHTGQSTEERLDQLMETIRTWDWRAAPTEAEGHTANATASHVSSLTATAPTEVHADPAEVHADPTEVQADPTEVQADPTEVGSDSYRRTDDAAPIREPQNGQQAVLEPPPPAVVPSPVTDETEDFSGRASSPLLSKPQPESGPRHKANPGPVGRLWSHRWTRMTILCVVAVAVVLLIIWGIRFVHKSPNSGGTFPTTLSSTPGGATQTTFVVPITTAQMARYKLYAQGLQKANSAATNAFISAGGTPTPATLTPTIAAYTNALNLYDFQLHSIQWAASMQAVIAADHTQLQALLSFLKGFSTVSSTGISGWLSGLHIRGSEAQTADNAVCNDLGLPSSSSFP